MDSRPSSADVLRTTSFSPYRSALPAILRSHHPENEVPLIASLGKPSPLPPVSTDGYHQACVCGLEKNPFTEHSIQSSIPVLRRTSPLPPLGHAGDQQVRTCGLEKFPDTRVPTVLSDCEKANTDKVDSAPGKYSSVSVTNYDAGKRALCVPGDPDKILKAENEQSKCRPKRTDRLSELKRKSEETTNALISSARENGLDAVPSQDEKATIAFRQLVDTDSFKVSGGQERLLTDTDSGDVSGRQERLLTDTDSGKAGQEWLSLKKTLEGTCSLDDLQPLNKKVIRIFFSSTFSDTKEERNALIERVYPKLSEYCRVNYGMEFQVVDMRWGVPEQASDNHSTTELCLQEIRKCQEVSAGPNFVAFIGDKYGYRPIPTMIRDDEFNILRDAAVHDKNWTLINEWYERDDNRIPAAYMLQTVSRKLKDFSNKDDVNARERAQGEWKQTETRLTKALRNIATRAAEAGTLTKAQMHQFFMSVTENEITRGILDQTSYSKPLPENVICIIRKIIDIEHHLDDNRASRFIDVEVTNSKCDTEAQLLLRELRDSKLLNRLPENTISKYEIEWKASGANITTEDSGRAKSKLKPDPDTAETPPNLNQYRAISETFIAPEKSATTEYNRKSESSETPTLSNVIIQQEGDNFDKSDSEVVHHNDYISGFCDSFYAKLSELIHRSGVARRQLYDETTVEVLQHLHFARDRCEVFEGRQDNLSAVKQYLSGRSTKPMIIYGKSGCGKTSIMAKVFERISSWRNEANKSTDSTDISKRKNITTVIRFLGTTPRSCNLRNLLTSVCSQLSITMRQTSSDSLKAKSPEKMSDLVREFHQMLKMANENQRLLILFDSVDQLLPTYDAYKILWLPDRLPRYVKLIVSTLGEGYEILDNFRGRYEACGGTFLELKELGKDVGLQVIFQWLRRSQRKITELQTNVVRQALEICSLPLYARIAFDQISKWCSYDHPTISELESTVQGAINQLYDQMEVKFGRAIVEHSLSYLNAARHGLSEVELEHILSLDDALLNEVFSFWCPPIRRVPPLLWTRIRADINSYIVERSADDMLVLCWYHRQFREATQKRYLSDLTFERTVHAIMVEYFSGQWGGGRSKPFKYTEAQGRRFKFDTLDSRADRKVPLQPYLISGQKEPQTMQTVQVNLRKASELPFHLFKIGNKAKLMKYVCFNYEWLYAKLCSSSTQSIIQEFEFFMDTDKQIASDTEIKILISNLQLIRSYVEVFPQSLAYELTGRLSKYIGKMYPLISQLVRHCDIVGVSHCSLLPILSCFESAELALKQNISIRNTEPWHEGGAITCTADLTKMYIIDYDQLDVPNLYVWDVKTTDLLTAIPIVKVIPTDVVDIYQQLKLTTEETHLIVCYIRKYYGLCKDRVCRDGFIDILSMSDGVVIRTIQEFLHNQPFDNCLLYTTKNWLGVRFGWKIPLLNMWTGVKKTLTQPHWLTDDETKFVRARSKKASVKSYQGEEKVVAYTRIKTATVSNFENKDNLGEFDKSDSFSGVTLSQDNSLALFADAAGNVNVYDIGSGLSAGKLIKVKRVLCLPPHEKITVFDLSKNDEEKQCVKQTLIMSPSGQFVVVCYQGISSWEAFNWNVSTGHFIRRLAKDRPTDNRYPSFSYDSQYIVDTHALAVKIIFAETGEVAGTFHLNSRFRSIYISQTSLEIFVMTGKDIAILDISKVERASATSNTENNYQPDNSFILPEVVINNLVYPAIIIEKDERGHVKAIEKTAQTPEEDSAAVISRSGWNGLNSGKKHAALNTWRSPNGINIVQLYAKVQVIDAVGEKILYTPKHGDVIQRTDATSEPVVIKSHAIPGLEDEPSSDNLGAGVAELLEGDRFVKKTDNKVRLRISESGRYRVATVPSELVIFRKKTADNQPTDRRTITIYQEDVASVSNSYVVSLKKKRPIQFLSIYDMKTGKLVITHECPYGDADEVGIQSGSLVRVSNDENVIFFVNTNLNLRVYSGKEFSERTASMDLTSVTRADLKAQRLTIKGIWLSDISPNVVIIHVSRFKSFGGISSATNDYIRVDYASKTFSAPLSVNTPLEDISKDNIYGISDQLTMYELTKPSTLIQIPYAKAGANMQLYARLSDDNRYLVFVDKHDDTIHVVRLNLELLNQHKPSLSSLFDPMKYVHYVASCFTHSPHMSILHGFMLRNDGRIIVVRSAATLLLLRLVDVDADVDRVSATDLQASRWDKIDYSRWSETKRALSFVK